MGLRVYRAEISVPFTEKSVPSACFYAMQAFDAVIRRFCNILPVVTSETVCNRFLTSVVFRAKIKLSQIINR